ncbi:hypothetical protein GGS24DRAFT_498574 [Hypoxylon argillaceum]|nr:hypothetical protein GGS24DRAFT_498574 [Hypoxylon argillaceum]
MVAFKSAYADYFDNGLKYEFITEISPNVWKISRKSDRMEYLAQDVTDKLFTDVNRNPPQLTEYGHLLSPNGHNLIENVKTVLNHANLVSLVDYFALQFSDSGGIGREKWFAVWDYCDAGNLGNLLLPSQSRPQDPTPKPDLDPVITDEDTEMRDVLSEPDKPDGPKFLSESFCWHVLTSLLRALTWLHDGVHDVVLEADGRWYKVQGKEDWSPMLHRNIKPQNIFIGYPRRKEWYGPVKLGNYGRLFISGHCQSDGIDETPTFSKVIGPPPDEKFASLEDLIILDTNHGSIYPHQPGQPYTLVSEYRAVGEIIQAIMVEPRGSKHMERIRSQPASMNLRGLNYSTRLKNFVVKLMEFDPWQKSAAGGQQNLTYVTSELYREAQEGVLWFLGTGTKEADAYVTSRMAEVDDYIENTALKGAEVFDSLQNAQEILEQLI